MTTYNNAIRILIFGGWLFLSLVGSATAQEREFNLEQYIEATTTLEPGSSAYIAVNKPA